MGLAGGKVPDTATIAASEFLARVMFYVFVRCTYGMLKIARQQPVIIFWCIYGTGTNSMNVNIRTTMS